MKKLIFLPVLLSLFATPVLAAPTASQRVQAVENHLRGKSFQGKIRMKVVKESGERELEFRIWSKGDDKVLIKIEKPPKDAGVSNLRIGLELWQFLPKVDQVVKIPTSMMLQSWMGSNFSNDDLVKTSSLSRDYSHKIIGPTTAEGQPAIEIELRPKPKAPVVWDKIILTVRASDSAPITQVFYNEKGEVVKRLLGAKLKNFNGHVIPTEVTMAPEKKPNEKTIIFYEEASYDQSIPESHFTQTALRKAM